MGRVGDAADALLLCFGIGKNYTREREERQGKKTVVVTVFVLFLGTQF